MNNNDKKFGKVLVVDDDEMFLIVSDKVLSRAFEVKTVRSGIEALTLLENGYIPGVILSDQKMPGMTGTEFLSKSKEYSPDSIRIIITTSPKTKEIIQSLNNSTAYMFISKPTENFELFQAVKLGIDLYRSKFEYKTLMKSTTEINKKTLLSNNSLKSEINEINHLNIELKKNLQESSKKLEELESSNTVLKNTIKRYGAFPVQMTNALSELIKIAEKYYYKPHTPDITDIVNAISEDLKLEHKRRGLLLNASLLHNLVLMNLPESLQLIDPYDMDDNSRKLYFQFFEKIIEIIKQIDILRPSAEIISQIWEHNDGSGYPNGISREEILIESQILSVAKIYHNLVYRLKAEDLNQMKENGVHSQIIPISIKRHKEAIGFLFKKSKWFDYDILRSFQDIVKHKECEALVPPGDILEIDLREYFNIEVPEEPTTDDDELQVSDDDSQIETEEATSSGIDSNNGENYIEKKIKVTDVKPGMISVYNVNTVSGLLVVKGDMEIDPSTVKRLIQMYTAGNIQEIITVKDCNY